nr:ubiquitin hydrolase [Tanacetum cinerariifolium]
MFMKKVSFLPECTLPVMCLCLEGESLIFRSLDGSSGTDLVSSLRTDLDGSSGTDSVSSLRTDLDGSSGTDLVSSLRTDLDGSLGTDLVSSLRIDLDGSLGTDLVCSQTTDLVWTLGNRSSLTTLQSTKLVTDLTHLTQDYSVQQSPYSKAEDPHLVFNKWYQSLVRSFDQQKNNIQAQHKKKMMKKNSSLSQVEERLVEQKEREVKYIEKIRTLEFYNESNNECIEILKKKLETLKEEKEGVDGKLAGLLTASKDIDNLIKSQRSDKNKEGLGYSAMILSDYSRPSPAIESTSDDAQNKNPSVSETVASPIIPKPFIKFVKPKDSQSKSKTGKTESPKKPPVKYAKQYRKPNKKPNVRGNQRNWNNLKTHQLGPDFVRKKKACFNSGDFNHLAYDCRKRVKKSFTPKPVAYRLPVRPVRTNMNGARPNITSFNKQAHSYKNRPFHKTSAGRSHYRAPWVPTVNRNFPTVNRKLPTGNSNVSTVCCCCSRHVNTARLKAVINRRNWVNNVKASACWVWKPIKSNSASIILKRYDYVDVRGRSSEDKKKQRNKKLEDSEAEHQV